MINVILADDHQIVLDGLKLVLEKESDIHVVSEAINGAHVLKALALHNVNIVVLDIEMPIMDGIEVTQKIKEQYPQVKVLILTMYNNEEFIKNLLEAGASGYILKNRGKEELVEALHKIADGGQYLGDAVTKTLLESMRKPRKGNMQKIVLLTKREKEVLKLIAKGYTTVKIAEMIFVAPTTVETHRRNMIDKLSELGICNTKDLVRYAVQNNYLKD